MGPFIPPPLAPPESTWGKVRLVLVVLPSWSVAIIVTLLDEKDWVSGLPIIEPVIEIDKPDGKPVAL